MVSCRLMCVGGVLLLGGCAAPGPDAVLSVPDMAPLALANRVTWGATGADVRAIEQAGAGVWLGRALRPDPSVRLPDEAEDVVRGLSISRKSLETRFAEAEALRREGDAAPTEEGRAAARKAYQEYLGLNAREAAQRTVLRDLYSPAQLQEVMTGFWLNHFSVFQHKGNIRLFLSDYEDRIRAHALGRFRDLLGAVILHPAMLRYLDNEQNARGHLNENLARELMELHTMGVDGGYTQQDVQSLARILSGLGIVRDPAVLPALRPASKGLYVRHGLFEFNPDRHEPGDKLLLGTLIRGQGLGETEAALDLLARQPATARFLARKLGLVFLGHAPSVALDKAMADAYLASDGRIDQVLRVLFASREFAASLGTAFKDPQHYVLSAVRLAYEGKVIVNARPVLGWLDRMGQPLYGHLTPDGYSMEASAWASPGQMVTRFEIARQIGNGSAGLFRRDGDTTDARAAFPVLGNATYYAWWQATLSAQTRRALDLAVSPQEWNALLLSSPEFMHR